MTAWEQELKTLSPEMQKYVAGLQALIRSLEAQIKELESRQILHMSLRLASVNAPTYPGKDHLGIAIYFIFGPPESPERTYKQIQEFGLAFGLSPEKYQELVAPGSNEVVIHEVKPENSRLKSGEQFPIEFLAEGEKDGDPQVSAASVAGDSVPGNDGGG